MSTRTGIQWTDATWNPVVGCDRVSPGCAHCYAKELHDQRHRAHVAGKPLARQYAAPFERVQLMPQRLAHPLSWRKPRRVFVNSVSDLFHDDVPDAFIDEVLAVMVLCQAYGRGHTFQVLTKRAERMRAYFAAADRAGWAERLADAASRLGYEDVECHVANAINGVLGAGRNTGWPLANLWLGVSVENQRFAEERIPLLLETPSAVRFLSCEPLLGPVDLRHWLGVYSHDGPPCCVEAVGYHETARSRDCGLHWVIVGGESGPKARPLDVRWAADLVAQCRAAGVATFVKQLGAVPMEPEEDWRGRATTRLLNAKNNGRVPAGFVPLLCRDKHGGGDPAEWPAELRVREMPRIDRQAVTA